MYSAGTKEVALDIKAKGIVPAGSMFLGRKPFLPFLLNGNYYFVQGECVAIPCTAKEVEALAKSGKVDYLVADSATLACKRKELLGLAFGTLSIPGTKPIYSRHLPHYGKIITLLSCKSKKECTKLVATKDLLLRAKDHMSKGELALAYKDVERVLARTPENPSALKVKRDLLARYYDCLHNPQCPSLFKSIEVLPNLVATARKVFRKAPYDKEAARIVNTFENLLAAECKAVYRWDKSLWQELEPNLKSLGLLVETP